MAKSTAKSIVKDIIIVAVGVAVIWFGLQVIFGTPNPFYVVSSGSMIPVLEVYDVLVVDGKVPFNDIQTGDIIVFNRPNGHDRVIVHRVVAVLDEEPKTIRTKGDANPVSIPGTDYPITKDEYIGKVAYVIPQIGYVTRILTPPINYIIIAVIIGIMIVKQYSKGKKHEPKFDTEPQKDPLTDSEEFPKQDDIVYSDPNSDITKKEEPKPDSNVESDVTLDSNKKDESDQNKSQ
ncbi:MAG TPA: signal peptidase I [Candidatus Nitrosotenuis sp.]